MSSDKKRKKKKPLGNFFNWKYCHKLGKGNLANLTSQGDRDRKREIEGIEHSCNERWLFLQKLKSVWSFMKSLKPIFSLLPTIFFLLKKFQKF